MAELNTAQQYNIVLEIRQANKPDGSPGDLAQVDGVPVWATSDATVILVHAADDGMSAVAPAVAPGGPARITVTADADLGAGVMPLIGVSEDINVVIDPATLAAVMTIVLGPAVAKA